MKTSEARKLYLANIEAELNPGPGQRIIGKRGLESMQRAVPQHPVCEFNEPDDAVLVTSDLHLGHANVIDYANRPFFNVNDMDDTLWDCLTAAVEPDKALVVVGDLAMDVALNQDTAWRLRELDCRARHLVIGNHDLTGAGKLRAEGFDRVWSLMVSGGEPRIIWTHYPLREVPEGYVNIHGHVHDDPPKRTPHINVSVEQLDYSPVPLTALRALACVLVRGEYPKGKTTLERLRAIGHTP